MESDNLPKYLVLKNYIIDFINNGDFKQGERVYSDYELASRFNVSRHTARQAMSELVNEGWLYRVKGKGTFVADYRNKRENTTASGMIGVMTTYLDDYIFPSIIKGMYDSLNDSNYSLVLSYTNNKIEKEAAVLSSMFQKKIDGLIIEPTKSALPNPNIGMYQEFIDLGIPIIFINGYYNEVNASYVVEDDLIGGYIAAKHLVGLGHKKIAAIFKVDDIQGHNRYKGFLKLCREKKLSINENAIIWISTEDINFMFQQENDNIFLKRIEDCTAIMCYNDQISLKVIELFKRNNIKVPDDMSLISFDDSDLAEITDVKLTTVAHPKIELGRIAGKKLLELIKDNNQIVKEVIQPVLKLRNSTMKCKK